jgi:hypothetical protein
VCESLWKLIRGDHYWPVARCDLTRYEFGAIAAFVRVWSRKDAIELIAHELEHVIEFTEGIDYRALAVVQPKAVWVSNGGLFETTRAVRAGLEVKREVSLADTKADRPH